MWSYPQKFPSNRSEHDHQIWKYSLKLGFCVNFWREVDWKVLVGNWLKAKPRHASHVSFTTAEGDQSEVEDDTKSAKSNNDGRTMAAPRGKKTPPYETQIEVLTNFQERLIWGCWWEIDWRKSQACFPCVIHCHWGDQSEVEDDVNNAKSNIDGRTMAAEGRNKLCRWWEPTSSGFRLECQRQAFGTVDQSDYSGIVLLVLTVL